MRISQRCLLVLLTIVASRVHADEVVPPVVDVSSEPNVIQPAPAISRLAIDRPLTSVSLSTSLHPEATETDTLRQPDDLAAAIYAEYGTHDDVPIHIARPRRCYRATYNPLYFEDPNMERCGKGCGCLTEYVSVIRFFGRIPLAPSMMGSQHPHICVRSPGHCPACHEYPCHAYLPPLNVPGVTAQALATVGMVFLLP